MLHVVSVLQTGTRLPSCTPSRRGDVSSGAGSSLSGSSVSGGGARVGIAGGAGAAGPVGRFSTAAKKFQSVAKAIAVTSKRDARPDSERDGTG